MSEVHRVLEDDLSELWTYTINARLDIGRYAFIDNQSVRCTRAVALRRYAPYVAAAMDFDRERLRALVAAATADNEFRRRDPELGQEMADLAAETLGLV